MIQQTSYGVAAAAVDDSHAGCARLLLSTYFFDDKPS